MMARIKGIDADGKTCWLNESCYWCESEQDAAEFAPQFAAEEVRRINQRNAMQSPRDRVEPELVESR